MIIITSLLGMFSCEGGPDKTVESLPSTPEVEVKADNKKECLQDLPSVKALPPFHGSLKDFLRFCLSAIKDVKLDPSIDYVDVDAKKLGLLLRQEEALEKQGINPLAAHKIVGLLEEMGLLEGVANVYRSIDSFDSVELKKIILSTLERYKNCDYPEIAASLAALSKFIDALPIEESDIYISTIPPQEKFGKSGVSDVKSYLTGMLDFLKEADQPESDGFYDLDQSNENIGSEAMGLYQKMGIEHDILQRDMVSILAGFYDVKDGLKDGKVDLAVASAYISGIEDSQLRQEFTDYLLDIRSANNNKMNYLMSTDYYTLGLMSDYHLENWAAYNWYSYFNL